MTSFHDLRLANRLAKAGKNHSQELIRLGDSIPDEVPEDADKEADWILAQLEEHKKTCPGCEATLIDQLRKKMRSKS